MPCNVIKCFRRSQHLFIWVASVCRTMPHTLRWNCFSLSMFKRLLSEIPQPKIRCVIWGNLHEGHYPPNTSRKNNIVLTSKWRNYIKMTSFKPLYSTINHLLTLDRCMVSTGSNFFCLSAGVLLWRGGLSAGWLTQTFTEAQARIPVTAHTTDATFF